ncbi:hypothetical protein BaRGS_00038641, partial [Batillaria attramentaria]
MLSASSQLALSPSGFSECPLRHAWPLSKVAQIKQGDASSCRVSHNLIRNGVSGGVGLVDPSVQPSPPALPNSESLLTCARHTLAGKEIEMLRTPSTAQNQYSSHASFWLRFVARSRTRQKARNPATLQLLGEGLASGLVVVKNATGKQHGGGVCLYVNPRWCNTVTVRDTLCTPDIELLTVSLRPFYIPREFPQLFFTLVYVHPRANAARAI